MTNLKLTLSSPAVTLTGDTGQITVSVTNTGLTKERVVLGVFSPLEAPASKPVGTPARPAEVSRAPAADSSLGALSAAEWTHVERPLREIAAGATEQFVATLDGRDAVPGAHVARFIAYPATGAPDESSDQAGVLTITKHEAPNRPAGGRRPWWLFAIAATVVLVIGAVAFLLLRDGENPPETAATTTASPAPSALCRGDLVPRLARPADIVCVSKASAAQVLVDNDPTVQDDRHPTPRGGPYGPETCAQGFVWREAFEGDTVCVDPPTRTRTLQENADAGLNAAP